MCNLYQKKTRNGTNVLMKESPTDKFVIFSVITKPPYEVTETGWGEFEVVIKIYFNDSNERPVRFYIISDCESYFFILLRKKQTLPQLLLVYVSSNMSVDIIVNFFKHLL